MLHAWKKKVILGKAIFASTRKLFEENQIWTPNEINKELKKYLNGHFRGGNVQKFKY